MWFALFLLVSDRLDEGCWRSLGCMLLLHVVKSDSDIFLICLDSIVSLCVSFCLWTSIHQSWPQILTPVSRVLLNEKTHLFQKHNHTLVSKRHLHWNQSLSVLCLLQICGCWFVTCRARHDLKYSKMLSPGNCPHDCRSLWAPYWSWVRCWAHNLCLRSSLPFGQTHLWAERQRKFGSVPMVVESSGKELMVWTRMKGVCAHQCSEWHDNEEWRWLFCANKTTHMWNLEPNARVHACEMCTDKIVLVWWDVLFTLSHPPRLGWFTISTRNCKKKSTLRKDCTKKAGTITHGTCAPPVSRSHENTILHSRFHQSCSSRSSFCHSFHWCRSLHGWSHHEEGLDQDVLWAAITRVPHKLSACLHKPLQRIQTTVKRDMARHGHTQNSDISQTKKKRESHR